MQMKMMPDCSQKGGYNPRDLCMMSCNSKTLIDDKTSCGLSCISYNKMKTEEEKE